MRGVAVRDILLVMFGLGWLCVIVTLTIQTGQYPPPEVWLALGTGVGGILGAFKGLGDRKDPPQLKDAPAEEAP